MHNNLHHATASPAISVALANLPVVRFLHWVTPVEEQPALSERLGINLLVKRDDLTGLAFGGNKVRQLEFYFGKILAAKADTVLITGAIQSNYTRVVAACAAQLGLQCHMLLEDRVPDVDETYRNNGNVFVDRLLGASIHFCPAAESEEIIDERLRELAGDLERQERHPYIISPSVNHPPLGALGYLRCAEELFAQQAAFDHVVLASGSGHSHAGILFGLRAFGWKGAVHGICVRREAAFQRTRIVAYCDRMSDMLGVPNPVKASDINVYDDVFSPGYGIINDATREAVSTCARLSGLLLDTVYTGRAMAGLFRCVRDGRIPHRSRVLFIHTGGLPALFCYATAFHN
jgi:D-cysteine desulfhydrase/L-cysteate sulfo-lyase